MATNLPQTIYATLGGPINQDSISRIFDRLTGATQGGAKTMHLGIQSAGGSIGDGIALYNLFRSYPLDLHVYNMGQVASIAVTAFVGAKHRYVASNANFMIHKVWSAPVGTLSAARLKTLMEGALIEDARIEAIVKAHTNIPAERWDAHAAQDVFFNAQEAVDFGIADSIREFQVPPGNQIFNV